MIGLAVGVVTGGIQFWLLTKFTARISGGNAFNLRAVLIFLGQFLLPFGVLVAIGFLRHNDLLPAALGIIGILLVGVISKYVINTRKARGRRDNNG